MNARRIVECVPNFSEGRDRAVIDSIAKAAASVQGVAVLDVDPGADTNRTVYTFAGPPEAVLEAAFRAARAGFELIDMSKHSGAHPRMGALDVCPFVPVAGVSMEECAELARTLGERIGRELGVPVYLYEAAASRPERKSLADIRSGEYEALEAKLAKPEWAPDFGPVAFVARSGACVVGAREFLVAYNVDLNTRDRKLANEIALSIREGGRAARDADGNIVKDAAGNTVKVPGRLNNVRAIGWYIDGYKRAQVSINLTDWRATSLHSVYETVKEEAAKLGLVVTGSEIVGLVPLGPLVEAGRHYLSRMGKSEGAPESLLVETAVRSLGLDDVAPFESAKKVVEYAVAEAAPLAAMTVKDFCDEVSADSPAPGGGSVSALAGSLAAALAAMVANLTVGKKGYEKGWGELSAMAVKAQALKDALMRAVDEDTRAFDAVMAAMKLPKATAEQQAARNAAIEEANKAAADVPLATAEACLEAIGFCADAARLGNKASASDSGVGALLARAGCEGAALNVITNLGSIADEAFKAERRARAEDLVRKAESACKEVLAVVGAHIGR